MPARTRHSGVHRRKVLTIIAKLRSSASIQFIAAHGSCSTRVTEMPTDQSHTRVSDVGNITFRRKLTCKDGNGDEFAGGARI